MIFFGGSEQYPLYVVRALLWLKIKSLPDSLTSLLPLPLLPMCLAVNNDSSQERYNYTKNFLKTDSFDNHAIAKLGGKCLKIFEVRIVAMALNANLYEISFKEKFSRSKDGTLDQPNKDFEDRDAYLDYATIASLPVLAADAAHLYLWAMPDRDDGWRLILYHDMELGVKCDYLTLER